MEKLLPVLLSHFLNLDYKIHCLHTDCRGEGFISIHPFLNEVYSFFWNDAVDWIKERCNILWYKTPCNLKEAIAWSSIEQLDSVPEIRVWLEIVYNDLMFMEWVLKTMVKVSWEEMDLVTQNKLIDYLDVIWKLRRKAQYELGK